ncbi:hypothetical protein J437_LFUL004857 [Ladona fulva]|uniref:Uncharacterized protein n=1 Tax=Ladona fulva TaxID=123851 RepID=A0A8K0K7D8_LADFU|nr:hypothetical protein J437_LFUL004857 [Ladona fulva]
MSRGKILRCWAISTKEPRRRKDLKAPDCCPANVSTRDLCEKEQRIYLKDKTAFPSRIYALFGPLSSVHLGGIAPTSPLLSRDRCSI